MDGVRGRVELADDGDQALQALLVGGALVLEEADDGLLVGCEVLFEFFVDAEACGAVGHCAAVS